MAGAEPARPARRRHLYALLAALSLLVPLRTLSAAPADKAAAETLFQEGLRLMQENELEAACQKLEASQKLDAAVGTLLRLGHCYEQLGRTASAWATFQEAVSLAALQQQVERREIAEARARALAPRLSTISVVVPARGEPDDLKITRNGAVVPRASWGVALPVDPGDHTLLASAPGFRSFRRVIRVDAPGVAHELRLPALEPVPAPEAKSDRPPLRVALPNVQADSLARDGGSSQRTWGLVVGGIGAAGLVAGGVLGVVAYARHQDSLDACRTDDPSACTPQGKRLRDGALDYARASTIAFIAGGTLVAGGIVLFATSPGAKQAARAELAVGPSSLSLRGAF